jgi:hypothetical protein
MKLRTKSILIFLLILIDLVKIPVYLHAQQADPDSLTVARIHSIQDMLDKGKQGADTWWYGWLAGYSLATVVQSGIAVESHSLKTRQDMILGAGTTFLGAAAQLLTPMTPARSPGRLSGLSEITSNEKKQKLEVAERLLELSAQRELEGRSWKAHAICGAVNLGSGLITWVGFDRDIWAGLGNFALNMAISEAQIWSQPRKAIKDYERYNKQFNPLQQAVNPRTAPRWQVSAYGAGVSVRLVF